jgi:hypothetical protein
MDVAHCILDVSMSEKCLNVEEVVTAPSLHCSFKMSESFEIYVVSGSSVYSLSFFFDTGNFDHDDLVSCLVAERCSRHTYGAKPQASQQTLWKLCMFLSLSARVFFAEFS